MRDANERARARRPGEGPAAGRLERRLRRRAEDFSSAEGLFREGDRVLAAVSGGPDSVMLLRFLADRCGAAGVPLGAAHVNHGLRPEAAADEAFVRTAARRLGLPFHRASVRLAPGPSLEERARKARYRALGRAMRAGRWNVLAVGHTLDDQAETVLMHLLRGAGLAGLGGMAPVVRGDGTAVVRPLLCVARREIEAALADSGAPWRTDATNRSPAFRRNRVRMELLPVLERFNPRVREHLARTAALLRDDRAALDAAADGAWQRVCRAGGRSVAVDDASFRRLPAALQRAVVARAVSLLTGSPYRSYRTVEDLRAAVLARNLRVRAPAGLGLAAEGRATAVVRRARPAPAAWRVELPVPGSVRLPCGARATARIVPFSPRMLRNPDPATAFLDPAAVGGAPVLRSPRPGDAIRPLGMAGTKKVSRILLDRKVPAAGRAAVPLLESGGKVLWVAGHAVSADARVAPSCRTVVRVSVRRPAPAND